MQLLTQKEVSSMLKVSIDSVKRLRLKGTLPTYKVGNRVRIPLVAVKLYLEKRKCLNLKSHHGSDYSQTLTTSFIIKTEEDKDRALGREIYKKQRRNFLVGSMNTKKIM